MLIERRVYVLHRGRAADFWESQRSFTASNLAGPMMSRAIGYWSGIGEEADVVTHLYAHADVIAWRRAHDTFYATVDPSYFELVRPWIRQQESDLFVAAAGYPSEWLTAPERRQSGPADALLTDPLLESEICLEPGNAGAGPKQPIGANPGWPPSAPLAVLRALTGRLHRLFRYDLLPVDALRPGRISVPGGVAEVTPSAQASSRVLIAAPIPELGAHVPRRRQGPSGETG